MLPAEQYRQPAAGEVLQALHDITAEYGYLPEEALRQAAAAMRIPLSQIYSAATFYSAFTFQPLGRHKLQLCEGTACYVRGATALLEQLARVLGIEADETTQDLLFTLKRVHCVGSCGLAPVLRVDGETYGRLTPAQITGILAHYQNGEQKEGAR